MQHLEKTSKNSIALGDSSLAKVRPSYAQSVGGFFRHHGIWAVGVRLFRNMAFAGKALIISLMFLLVIAQLAFIVFRANNELVLTSERELVGVAQVQELLVLLRQAQDLRHSTLASQGKQTADVTDRLEKVGQQLTKVEGLQLLTQKLSPRPSSCVTL